MKVCICSNVNDKDLLEELNKVPWLKDQDPFSWEYVTKVDQAYNYLQKTLSIGTQCASCELFIRQIIRDALDRYPSIGM